jgi:hypothetical protein
LPEFKAPAKSAVSVPTALTGEKGILVPVLFLNAIDPTSQKNPAKSPLITYASFKGRRAQGSLHAILESTTAILALHYMEHLHTRLQFNL